MLMTIVQHGRHWTYRMYSSLLVYVRRQLTPSRQITAEHHASPEDFYPSQHSQLTTSHPYRMVTLERGTGPPEANLERHIFANL